MKEKTQKAARGGFDSYWAAHPKDGRLVCRQISRNLRFYDLIKKHFVSRGQEKLKILEVGCGTAIDSYYLREETRADVFAMDSSKRAIEQAQRLAKYFNSPINLVTGDIRKICFKDNTFDFVFSQGVMEHFLDYGEAYKEQVRVLKNNGILLVHVPQKYNLYSVFSYFRSKTNRGFGKEFPYSARDMESLGKQFGIKLLKMQGQDFFILEICRFLNTQLMVDASKHYSFKPKGIHRYFEQAINFAEEVLWRIMGKRFGQHMMMNIIGVYQKSCCENTRFI